MLPFFCVLVNLTDSQKDLNMDIGIADIQLGDKFMFVYGGNLLPQ